MGVGVLDSQLQVNGLCLSHCAFLCQPFLVLVFELHQVKSPVLLDGVVAAVAKAPGYPQFKILQVRGFESGRGPKNAHNMRAIHFFSIFFFALN